MRKNNYFVHRVAVVGSGTMGAGIAALLAGAGFPVLLLDVVPGELTDQERALGLSLQDSVVRNRIVCDNLLKSHNIFYAKRDMELITIGNLEDDFEQLTSVDWVVEAIVENIELKKQFFQALDRISPIEQIVSTNTSGLPIHELSVDRSDEFKSNFLGVHFFNPPRHMKLLEIIPTSETNAELVDFFCSYVSRRIGKNVVLCKDTPSFIANRIGLANNFWRMSYAMDNGYTVEEVDAIGGMLMGYPSTAVFRLMDLVGIDVIHMIGSNINQMLPMDFAGLKKDSTLEKALSRMLEHNWIGNKVKAGFYKQILLDGHGKQFWPLDFENMTHNSPSAVHFESLEKIREIGDLGQRLRTWLTYNDRASDYVWHTLAFLFSYVSTKVLEISNDLISVDNAMRWGYMMDSGPFEVWDMLGVANTVDRMKTDGYTVDSWVTEMIVSGNSSFYRECNGSREQYDWNSGEYVSLSSNYPLVNFSILNEKPRKLEANSDATLFDIGSDVLQLEFHSKANTIGIDTLEIIQTSLNHIEASDKVLGLVIGNQGKMFSAGANVDILVNMSDSDRTNASVNQFICQFQNTMQKIRYCTKPVVAAPFGLTLGGAAELVLASSRVVANVELRMGLVEVGIGLIPAGGGCKEILRRLVNPLMRIPSADPIPFVRNAFEMIRTSQVSNSAFDAQEVGFMHLGDRIVLDKNRLLSEAKAEVVHMSQSNYSPPRAEKIYVGGQNMAAVLTSDLFQMYEAKHITDHDLVVGQKLGWILSGGDITASQFVDEQYILDLERTAFSELICLEKTLDRIVYTLKTGQRLRN